MAETARSKNRGDAPRRNFKLHQVHEQAEAKIKESERLRQALGISKNYEEGSYWKKQEEHNINRKAQEKGDEDDKDEDRR